MNMLPIMLWMVSEKLAQNEFAASQIATRLQLWELPTEDAMKARVKLYRRWRPKTDKKNMLPHIKPLIWQLPGLIPPMWWNDRLRWM